jgi:hypothetical protein
MSLREGAPFSARARRWARVSNAAPRKSMAAAQVDGLARGRQFDAVEQDFDIGQPVGGFSRVRLDRAGQVGSRFRQAPGLPFQQAQLVLRLGVAGMHVEDGAAQRSGLVELAGIDVLVGELHGLFGNALDLFIERYNRGVLHECSVVTMLGFLFPCDHLATLVQAPGRVKEMRPIPANCCGGSGFGDTIVDRLAHLAFGIR